MANSFHLARTPKLRLAHLKRPSKNIITQKLLVILDHRNQLSTSGCSNRRIFTIF
jgi:hypothetical protein